MPHPLSDVPELSQLEAGRGLVRIPVEQDVPFTPRVRALVDTPQFQRLRHVSQLGLTALVYPGATHTRFEHALGVFHNAVKYLAQLGKDARFRETADRHAVDVLLSAALLHDLGHWPFAHPVEDMSLADLPSHEAYAREFLADGTELADVLRKQWDVEPGEILTVLDGEPDSPSLRLVQSVLSGPIDVDKMDYLDRDSLHCGVPYGRNFDRQRLMQSLLLNETGDGLAVSEKGRTAAELMVFARYVMFSEVYWHHAVRAATCQFGRGFYELRGHLDLDAFFRLGDAEAVAELRRRSVGTAAERLLDGLFGANRRLYKRAAEFSAYQHPDVFRSLARRPYAELVDVGSGLAERLATTLGTEVTSTDVLVDAPPPAREVQFRVPIYYAKEDVYRPLEEVSPVVASLAREQFDDFVKRVRVFVHPRLRDAVARDAGFLESLRAAAE
jgi:HD superfamily phosphohydrolase